MFSESGGSTIASQSVDVAVAPLDSANTAKLAVFADSGDESNGEGHRSDSANTANLAVFAESGGATISSEFVDDAVAPPDTANTAKLAVFAESGGATYHTNTIWSHLPFPLLTAVAVAVFAESGGATYNTNTIWSHSRYIQQTPLI